MTFPFFFNHFSTDNLRHSSMRAMPSAPCVMVSVFVTTICYLLFVSLAAAQPVLVTVGSEKAQGLAFKFSLFPCYVLTVDHVLKKSDSQVRISTSTGEFQKVEIVARNHAEDLALLQIPDTRGNSLCSTRVGSNHFGRLSNALTNVTIGQHAWLDQIDSSGGGFFRELLKLTNVDARVPRVRAIDEDFFFARGDSGSPVYSGLFDMNRDRLALPSEAYQQIIEVYDSYYRSVLFVEDGNSLIASRLSASTMHGRFYGIITKVEQNEAILIPKDVIVDFLAETINPFDWSDITIDSGKVLVESLSRKELLSSEILLKIPGEKTLKGIQYILSEPLVRGARFPLVWISLQGESIKGNQEMYGCGADMRTAISNTEGGIECRFSKSIPDGTVVLRISGKLSMLNAIKLLFE